jgi:hypothetical protein
MRAVDLDFSGVIIRLEGLGSDLAERVQREWSAFLTAHPAPAFLRIAVDYLDRQLPPRPFEPHLMLADLGAGRARFEMPEGRAEIAAGGRARLRLCRGLGPREYWTLVNLLRAVLAWRMPDRGGALLHAAGVVLDGRGFILVGPEGSGKSTWSRLSEQAGAHVLSDDLVLLDGARPTVQVLGAPFRSTHVLDLQRGGWPLAAILFPVHGSPAACTAAGRLWARARLVANLPFVAEAVASDERIAAVVEHLVTAVPCHELTFAPDSGFIRLLRELP